MTKQKKEKKPLKPDDKRIGNNFAKGLTESGRPPMYSNPKDLENKIDEYFKSGLKKRKIVVGSGKTSRVVEIEVPTITGLAYYLGFESRQSFYDYEEKKEFTYIVRRSRLFIESEYEEQLQYGNVTGAIFALKNMGWKEQIETKNINYNSEPLDPKKIKEIRKAIRDEYL